MNVRGSSNQMRDESQTPHSKANVYQSDILTPLDQGMALSNYIGDEVGYSAALVCSVVVVDRDGFDFGVA